MKTLRNTATGDIIRVSDSSARYKIKSDPKIYEYVSKSVWKEERDKNVKTV